MRGYPLHELLFLCAVLLLAAALRYYRATAGGISFDEMWHLELSTGHGSPHATLPTDQLIASAPTLTSLRAAAPISRTWTNLSTIVHPPLFIIVLRAWRALFGESDLAARALSVVCALVAIALLFDAVRTLHGTFAASCAALILSLASTQTYLGQQVRGYAMLQMWACAALAALARIEKCGTNWRRQIALALSVTAMLLTHYFGIFGAIAIAAYSLIRVRGIALRGTLLALTFAIVAFALAWGPFMWRQRATAAAALGETWLTEAGQPWLQHAKLTLGRMLAIPVRQISQPMTLRFGWPIFAGAAFFLIALISSLRRRSDLMLWLVWIASTLGVLALIDLCKGTQQLSYPRYTILVAPAVCALIGAIGAASRQPVVRFGLPTITLIYALLSLPIAYTRAGEAEWYPLGNFIAENSQPGETLIFYSGNEALWYRDILLLGTSHYSRVFPRPIVKLSRPADAQLIAALPGQTAWLISGPLDRPPDQIVPGARAIASVSFAPVAQCTRLALPR